MRFLTLLLAFPIYALQAQDISTLVPDNSISTESKGIFVYPIPKGQVSDNPAFNAEIKPQGPNYNVNDLPLEFVRNLKAGQLANAIRLGWFPANVDLRMLASKRSAQEDLEFYSLSIKAHQRAITEGKDVNFYIDEIKAGRYSVARLKRDVEVCGTGFEFWPNSKMCNQYPTHEICEQQKDAADLTVKILQGKLESATKTIEQLNILIAKLSKKKGNR